MLQACMNAKRYPIELSPACVWACGTHQPERRHSVGTMCQSVGGEEALTECICLHK